MAGQTWDACCSAAAAALCCGWDPSDLVRRSLACISTAIVASAPAEQYTVACMTQQPCLAMVNNLTMLTPWPAGAICCCNVQCCGQPSLPEPSPDGQALQRTCRSSPAEGAELLRLLHPVAAQKLPDLQPLLNSFPEPSKLVQDLGDPQACSDSTTHLCVRKQAGCDSACEHAQTWKQPSTAIFFMLQSRILSACD